MFTISPSGSFTQPFLSAVMIANNVAGISDRCSLNRSSHHWESVGFNNTIFFVFRGCDVCYTRFYMLDRPVFLANRRPIERVYIKVAVILTKGRRLAYHAKACPATGLEHHLLLILVESGLLVR